MCLIFKIQQTGHRQALSGPGTSWRLASQFCKWETIWGRGSKGWTSLLNDRCLRLVKGKVDPIFLKQCFLCGLCRDLTYVGRTVAEELQWARDPERKPGMVSMNGRSLGVVPVAGFSSKPVLALIWDGSPMTTQVMSSEEPWEGAQRAGITLINCRNTEFLQVCLHLTQQREIFTWVWASQMSTRWPGK